MRDFVELFESFRRKFPPVSIASKATLKLTSEEVLETFNGFWPSLELTADNINQQLKDHDYIYEPFEVNDRIVFYWLIGSTEP